MPWHWHLLLSMPCLTLLLLTPSETACPSTCLCRLDPRGKRTVACLEGGLTMFPTSDMDLGTEVVVFAPASTHPNMLTLAPIFQHLRSLQELRIRFSSLTHIGMHTFWGVPTLRILDLAHNNISTLFDHNFRGLLNLEELYLHDNAIQRLASGVFRHLTELRALDLQRNRIKEMETRAFVKLTRLRVLKLSENPIVELPPEPFKDIVELRVFECRACSIQRINTQIYHLLPHLSYLDLGKNRLQFLPAEEFHDLKRVQTLLLDRNQFPVVLERTFEHQHLLHTLSLSWNRLAKVTNGAFINMSSLVNLDLSFNQLVRLESVSFHPIGGTLRVLNLSGNRFNEEVLDVVLRTTNKLLTLHVSTLGLRSLPMGMLPTGLKFLNVSNNNLTKIALQSLPRGLQELDVSRNQFEGFDERLVVRLELLKVLWGVRNPWACDWCAGKFMIMRVNKTRIFDNLTCATPLRLHGVPFNELKLDQINHCRDEENDEESLLAELMEENSVLVFGGAFLVVFLIGCIAFVVFSCWRRNRRSRRRPGDEEAKRARGGTVLLDEHPMTFLGVKGEIAFKFPLDLTERHVSIATIDDDIKTHCRTLPNGTGVSMVK